MKKTVKLIDQLLNSGQSRRWHSNPDMADKADDLAQHQWSVAMIALYLKPDLSRAALIEVLTHDVGEMVAGDLSYDFKINNPEVAEVHKKAEMRYRSLIVNTDYVLTDKEVSVLKFADWLSSYYWVALKKPDLLFRKDWTDQISHFTKEGLKQPFKNELCKLMNYIYDVSTLGATKKIDLDWSFNKGLKEYDTTD